MSTPFSEPVTQVKTASTASTASTENSTPELLLTAVRSSGFITARQLTIMAVVIFILVWGLLPEFTVVLLSYIGLYALVAAGLVMLTGVGGMISFGQGAFVGLGAYSTAWVCTSPTATAALAGLIGAAGLPWAGLLVGLAITFAVAWTLGAMTVKLSGHYLPLCTIAWGLSLYYLFGNMQFLGGQTGISGVPPLLVFGYSLASPRSLGVLIWAVLLTALWLLHNLLDSREGRAIRALKGSRIMAESMGIDTARYRLKLFVLGALMAALSGWLYAHMQRFVNPSPFNLSIGIEYLFMAVVGGSGHLWGAVLGAAVITLLKEKLQDILPGLLGTTGNFEVIVFGLLMLFVLQRFAGGIWPSLEMLGKRVLRAKVSALASTPALASASASGSIQTSTRVELPQREVPAQGAVLLQATGITKRFGGLVANNNVSMNIRAGEIHALIGPNGAGKSTFFNMISGVDDPTEGQVHLMGVTMDKAPSRHFASLGLGRTFQHVRLLGQRTVTENVALGAHRRARSGWIASMLRLDRAEEQALLAEAHRQIDRCGLTAQADTPADALALGQQRVVEIARALAGQPAVLLLDEPAAGLRHLEKRALASLLSQLRAEGLGIVVVEHDMEFVMNLADRITVFDFGSVIAEGTPAEVRANQRVLDAYLGGADEPIESRA